MGLLETALLVLLAGYQQCVTADPDYSAPLEVIHNGPMYATCRMRPSTGLPVDLPRVYGQVLFKQDYPYGKLQVLFRLHGLPIDRYRPSRAVHIHQYGDLSYGCNSTGDHYNPKYVNHPNHPGDFGNFVAKDGKINTLFESEATLFKGLSVIGRAVVIHEKKDDLGRGGDDGSLLHGNAGRRLACCIIGISPPAPWVKMYKYHQRRH